MKWVVIPTTGSRVEMRALGSESKCEFGEFLTELKRSDPNTLARIVAFLDRVSHHGPPNSKRKCEKLKNADEIWEFKIHQIRILWFFVDGRILMITHGFRKKSQKTPRREIQHAVDKRVAFLGEQGEVANDS